MAKIFETSDDIVELIENKFAETGLDHYGFTLKIMSVAKSKDIIKVSKASAVTQFLTKKDDMITILVYEELFDRLNDTVKEQLVEMALSNISFDSEKDKLMIESNPYIGILNVRGKYPNILDSIEVGLLAMRQIEEEEKERKAAEREAKKAAKQQRG